MMLPKNFDGKEQDRGGAGGSHGPDTQLKLACPECGAWGMATMQNLHHLFYCRRCRQWYRVEGASFSRVSAPPTVVRLQVRSGLSHWRNDKYNSAARRTGGATVHGLAFGGQAPPLDHGNLGGGRGALPGRRHAVDGLSSGRRVPACQLGRAGPPMV